MRKVSLAVATLCFVAAGPGLAASCKDAKTGKFIACPPKASEKVARCKSANGRFAKCGTQGATPM